MKQAATSHLEVDFNRLDDNIAILRRTIGADASICAVIKADAYGLGAVPIAARMHRLGVEMFAVFTPDQARELVTAGLDARMLLFMPLRHLDRHDILYRALISGRLHCVVHDREHLQQLVRIAETFGCILPLHVEVDTGMSRGGMPPEEARQVIADIFNHRRLHLAGLFTHFSSADGDEDATIEQFNLFARVADHFDDDLFQTTAFHAANTDAAFAYGPRFHLDMVRVGLGWIGYSTSTVPGPRETVPTPETLVATSEETGRLQPIVRWVSSIVHVKWIDPGSTVGYGRTWSAIRPTRVGLVPVGYADGYPVALSNQSILRVQDRDESNRPRAGGQPQAPMLRLADAEAGVWNVPVIGRVSMDQLTVDLTDVPESVAGVGTEIELLSDDREAPNNLLSLARLAGTIPYELLCRVSNRVPRRYLDRAAATPGVPWRTAGTRPESQPRSAMQRRFGVRR